MGRRTLDNPQVQGDRPRRGKARPSDRRLRAIERRLDYLEAEVTTRRQVHLDETFGFSSQLLSQKEQAAYNRECSRSVSNTFFVRGEIRRFMRRRPILDAIAWLVGDVRVPRGVLLGLAIALFGALLDMAARWWL